MPPNIVVVVADQLAPHFTGTYGHRLVRTPNLDALAARGTAFDAAYCNSPLCAPARYGFMTGRLPSRIGAFDNASELPASIPTFAHHLRTLGYRTCLTGKMHFVGPDQLHGFEERLTTDVYPADFGWIPDWERPDERIARWYHNMDSVTEAGIALSSFQHDFDDEVAFTANRRLWDYARTATSPFCMVVGFTHPHDPFVARPEQWDRYDHDAIELPATPVAHDPQSRRVRAGIEADRVEVSEEQVRRARHAYYANVSYVDDKLGELITTLRDGGLLDDTVVIFTADHGEALGERGNWYKMTLLEHSARVPLVMAGPGVARQRVGEPCSLVDVLPTLLDIASEGRGWPATGAPLDGRSLLPVASGRAPLDPDTEAVAEYCGECTSHPSFMIRRHRHKFISNPVDPPMLFDLEADPAELVNLAEDPDHAHMVADLEGEVASLWDADALRAEVIASQHRRRAVRTAMAVGTRTDWDHQPRRDASEEYVRNHIAWTDAAALRFPPFES